MKELINGRLETFLGYGELTSNIWFIGMEEGGGNNLREVIDRIRKEDGKEVVDIRDDDSYWFNEDSPSQSTWSKLIYLSLTLQGRIDNYNLQLIKKYQYTELCSKKANESLLELMSLPSPSIQDWYYKDLEIDSIKTRSKYLTNYLDTRVNLLSSKIDQYLPEVVICYGSSYLKYYSKIIKKDSLERINSNSKVFYEKYNNTHFFVIPHPVARLRNSDWEKIGSEIKSKV